MHETPISSFIENTSQKPFLLHDASSQYICDLVMKFFEIYASWQYPKPIFIHKINHWESDSEMYDESSKSHLPILTPFKPRCTTMGITKSSLNKIVDEMKRAYNICLTVRYKQELLKIIQEVDSAKDGGKRKRKKQFSLNESCKDQISDVQSSENSME